MKTFRMTLLLVLSLAAVVFSVANRHPVNFSLAPLPWSAEIPLYILMLLISLLGMIVGGSAVTAIRVKKWRQRRRAERDAQPAPDKSSAADKPDTGPGGPDTRITLQTGGAPDA